MLGDRSRRFSLRRSSGYLDPDGQGRRLFKKNRKRKPALLKTLTVDFAVLELHIRKYLMVASKRSEWIAWAGLVAAFSLPLAGADFSYTGRRYGFSGEQWKLLLVIASTMSLVMMIRSVLRSLASPTIDDFVEELAILTDTVPNRRVIFILKRESPAGAVQLLSYYSQTWECYLLPNVNVSYDTLPNDADLGRTISDLLGIGHDDVRVGEIEGCRLESSKFSFHYKREMLYIFHFYFVSLPDEAAGKVRANPSKFTIDGRMFRWQSVAQMQAHSSTRERNSDVLKFISENAQQILHSTPSTFR